MRSIKFIFVLFGILVLAGCAQLTPMPAPTAGPTTVITAIPENPTIVVPTVPAMTGKMRVALTEVSNAHSLPMLMALDALQAQGVEVQITTLASSSLVAAALTQGDADMAAFNNQTMWSAIAKGAQARTIMQRYFTAPQIYTKVEFKTCADLNNRPIGFASISGVTPSLFDQYLTENCPGAKPQRIQISSNAMLPAIQAGTIDGGQFSVEQMIELDQTAPGKYHVLIDLGKAYPKVQSSGIHVDKAWAEQNSELVKAFIRTLLAIHRQIRENPQLLYDQAVKRLGVTPEVAKRVVDADLEENTWDQNGGMTQDNVQYTLDFLSSIQALTKPMTAAQVTDLSYLQAVLDEIGRK